MNHDDLMLDHCQGEADEIHRDMAEEMIHGHDDYSEWSECKDCNPYNGGK